MLSGFFGSKEIDALSRNLVDELVKRFPPELEKRGDKEAVKKLSKATEFLYLSIQEYSRANRLSVFKKARLGNNLLWELKERGYSSNFAEWLSNDLVAGLGRAR